MRNEQIIQDLKMLCRAAFAVQRKAGKPREAIQEIVKSSSYQVGTWYSDAVINDPPWERAQKYIDLVTEMTPAIADYERKRSALIHLKILPDRPDVEMQLIF